MDYLDRNEKCWQLSSNQELKMLIIKDGGTGVKQDKSRKFTNIIQKIFFFTVQKQPCDIFITCYNMF